MTSPVAQAYIDSVSRAAFAGYNDSAAAGQTPDIPNPLEDTDPNRSYTQFNIFRQQQRSETSSSSSSGDNGGDNDTMSPEEYAKQVEYFKNNKFAGVSNKNKVYEDSIAGWLEEKIDKAVAPKVKFNDLTQTYRVTSPGGGINMMLGPLAPFVAIGSFLSQKNLENIQEQVIAGKKGFGIGLLDNAIIGASPLPEFMQDTIFDPGYGSLSGRIPETPRGYSTSAHLMNIYTALEAQADAVAKGVAIPDITTAYNIATYGSPEGSELYSSVPGGVFSYTQNPLGSQYADVKTPVMVGDSDRPVTLGSSGYVGSDLVFDPSFGYDPTDYTTPPVAVDMFDDPSDFDPAPDMGIGQDGPDRGDNNNNNDGGGGGGNTGSDDTGGPSGGDPSSGGTDPDANDDSGMSSGGGGMGGGNDSFRAYGGRIGMRNGGEASPQMGFVNKDPRNVSDSQGIADNRYTSVPQGSFVMNQPANEMYKDDLDVVLGDAEKRAGSPQSDGNMVDVALSDGERLIRPEVVDFVEKKYGGGFLDNINNTGKPEVQRRQVKYGAKIGAADGGFLADQGMEAKDVGKDVPVGDYQPISEELRAKLTKFAAKKPKRGDIRDFIKSLPPEEKLTVLFLTETQSTTDPIESMEAIGEVVNNRINSNYYDFKNIKTLDDALLKQTKRGAFQFSGLEPSTFFERAKEVKGGTASKGLAKAYAAAQNVLDPETEGANRLDPNTLFYTRKDAPSQWMRESKDLEFSTELGGHEFYRTFASPEFP